MPKVSVIIINFNTRDLLRSCLQNLTDLNEAAQIIVVDNASSDGSAKMVRDEFPAVDLIALDTNTGLTVASNRGLTALPKEVTQSDTVLYLGSDAFPQAGVVQGIAEYLEENPDVGIATAKLVMRDGMLDMDAHRGFPTPWASFTHFSGLNRLFPQSRRFNSYFLGHEPLDQPHEIDLCISHFMMMRRSLFDTVGLWDEDFFVYGEDVDFCYRTKEAGYKIMFLPQFEVLHYKGASVGIRKQTQDISNASAETRKRASQASTKAMDLFYRKHMADKYPWFINAGVLGGVKVLAMLRNRR